MKAQNRILDTLINRGALAVTARIADYHDLGNGLVKVVATFSRQGTKTEYRSAIAAAVDGMGQAVENSFSVLAATAGHAAVGFLTANPEVIPFNDPAVAAMRTVTANVLMDADDRVWSVRDTAAGKCLVRTSDAELPMVVAGIRKRQVGVPVLASMATAHVNAHEFVTYATAFGLKRGFVLSSVDQELEILPLDDEGEGADEVEAIAEDQVVDTREFDADVLEEITAATVPSTTDKGAMKDYYSKVYGYNPEYLKQFLALIDDNKVL